MKLGKTLIKNTVKMSMGLAMMATSAMAAETLFSNDVFNVNETGSVGSLWAFSRGQVYSGVTLLSLEVGASGNVIVKETRNEPVADSLTAVQEGIFTDKLAEHRRTPAVIAGRLGYVLPMFEMEDEDGTRDSLGGYRVPLGFFSVTDVNEDPEPMTMPVPDAFKETESPMDYAVSGFAYDSSARNLWIARGAAGLGLYDISGSSTKSYNFALNMGTSALDSAKVNYKWNDKNPYVFGVALHPETRDLWMATSKGVWVRTKSGNLKKASSVLDTNARVTGVWIGGNPLQIVAETSEKKKGSESVKGNLWRMANGDTDFSKVNFLDTAGKAQKKDVYDDGNYTVTNVAFVGKEAFVGVMVVGGEVSGLFKLDSSGIRARKINEDGKGSWLYGYEAEAEAPGVTDRDARITSVCAFPLTKSIQGLAVSTYGNGISVSADTGKTWTPILNRAKLGGDLGTVRMVPSVIGAGDQSLVSYKVSKGSKITIDVFSYDMKHVRTVVKDAPREPDASRSTVAREDYWDGYDKHGRACTMGVYYVRVKDNHGHVGWGKVMTLGGHK